MILYFIPDAMTLTPALLAQAGLDRVIEKSVNVHTSAGPNGGSGLLVADSKNFPQSLRHDPAAQKWQRRFGSEAWIGTLNDAKPTPAMFVRDNAIQGVPYRLSDGHRYIVPVLRSFDPEQLEGPITYRCNLDQTLQQDPDSGHMVPGEVTSQYADVWETATTIGDQLLQQITGGDPAELPDSVLIDFACQCLALNYRLEKPELSALGLLTVQQAIEVMRLAIDWPHLRVNLKNRLSRRVSGGTNSESGETPQTEDSPTPTDPPSPN